MKLYKLTDENWESYGRTQWGHGVEHTAPGNGRLCTAAYLHAYRDPILAALVYPAHISYVPIMWEADGDVEKDDGLKVGCTRLRTIDIIVMPEPTMEQRIAFGILCAKQVMGHNIPWTGWANRWLSGEDRSTGAAYAVAPEQLDPDAASHSAYAATRATKPTLCLIYAAYAAFWTGRAGLQDTDFTRLAYEAMEY